MPPALMQSFPKRHSAFARAPATGPPAPAKGDCDAPPAPAATGHPAPPSTPSAAGPSSAQAPATGLPSSGRRHRPQASPAQAATATTGHAAAACDHPATGAPSVPTPRHICDSRFEKRRLMRAVCCDCCERWYRGNAVGAFWQRSDMPAPEFRREAWEAGEWDASWYCIDCYAESLACSETEVRELLGFTARQVRRDEYQSEQSDRKRTLGEPSTGRSCRRRTTGRSAGRRRQAVS